MNNSEKLKRIAEIIERVDQRRMAADGPVTLTLQEMSQDEISEIYKLASQQAGPVKDYKRYWVLKEALKKGANLAPVDFDFMRKLDRKLVQRQVHVQSQVNGITTGGAGGGCV